VVVYILKRLIGIVPVLVVTLIVTFGAIRALPGDPVTVMLSDHSANVEMADRLRAEYGLDRPVLQQFVDYSTHALRGQFGFSYRYVHVPVIEVLGTGLVISPLLALAAIFLALPFGIIAGTFAAVHRNQFADTAVIVILVIALSIPDFAIATFLVYLLCIKLGLLPVAGWGSLAQAVLPVAVLAVPSAAYIARLSRTFMLEVLQQDYIRTLRAKGLGERLVIYRHALRNVLIPVLTQAGIIFGGLLSNTFVVETIFNIPGLGRLAIESVFARDYPVAMAVVLLFVLFFVLINLMIDVLYAAIDPRLRARMAAA